MKNCVYIIGVLFISALSVSGNLLSNPGFEQGLLDWSSSGSAGVEVWAARSGGTGAVFQSWNASPGAISQNVSVSETGEFTFCVWVCRENFYTVATNILSIEWLDNTYTPLQAATIQDISSVPNDRFWHHVYVSGSCVSSALAYVRVTMAGSWNVSSETPKAYMLDDAELYIGSYTGASQWGINQGFEDGPSYGGWAGSAWNGGPTNTGGGSRDSWAARNGNFGAGIHGADDVEYYDICQPVYPQSTGTYTFSVWMAGEDNLLGTNCELRLEWYDHTYTNKVAEDAVTNFVFPTDNIWREYYITGACTNESLFEVRPIIRSQWDPSPYPQTNAAKFDDVRFSKGIYHASALDMDWTYHSGIAHWPTTEPVPETNVGMFLQADYASTSMVVYVLAEEPTQCTYPQQEQNSWEMRRSFERPEQPGTWITDWHTMTRQGIIEITVGAFHDLPAAGVITAGLWKCNLPMATAINGVPYDEAVKTYYAPYTKATNDSLVTGENYLLFNGEDTNNLGQPFGIDPAGRDYACYPLFPQPLAAFTNGGFESPTNTIYDFADTGWRVTGPAGREVWAARSGQRGAYFPTWFGSGREEYSVCQDVAAGAGTNTFSVWMRQEPGANPELLELRMDWYDSRYRLLDSDIQNMLALPKDGGWHPAYVTGACDSNDIAFVRLSVRGVFAPKTTDPSALAIDDADYYPGEYTGIPTLTNGSFEQATGTETWRGSCWYSMPERASQADGASRKEWAWRSGQSGVALYCFTNDVAGAPTNFEMTIAQAITPGTGTYTFSIWMLQEDHAILSNAALTIEWLDRNYQPVKPTDTKIIATPLTNWWTRHDLTATCTNEDLFEVRLGIYTDWSTDSNPGHTNQQVIKIDDAHFVRGTSPYIENGLDWLYYNAGPLDPDVEEVPGTNVGVFIQVDYPSTTTAFYVLGDDYTQPTEEEMSARMGFRTTYFDPEDSLFIDAYEPMAQQGSVIISDGLPFHGLPVTGAKALSLWQYNFTQPLDNTGVPLTNEIIVYYSPYLERVYNGVETNRMYLAIENTDAPYTNNYPVNPQLLADWHYNRDYAYTNLYTINTNFHDGIPNAWWAQYWPVDPFTNRANADNDGDAVDNWQEYIADTVPTNAASVFVSEVTNGIPDGRTTILLAGPPTSPSRLYDVWYKTNLMEESPWIRYGLDVVGIDEFTPVTLQVTNDAEQINTFRTGVRLP
ncbi:MAG: hypothetical protein EOM20_13600 [Spartobacteria bacterium]|nr:hypothetical protein [Spartobacteria bacterium]